MIDISIPKAVDQLSKFFDYLVEKDYISSDDCDRAKKEMWENVSKWVQQENDWLEIDYDEYNEKYWGFSL